MGLNVIIFSCDRACQCDFTIRSIEKHIKVPFSLNVLYIYSNDFYKKGYDKLFEVYKDRNIVFKKETNFKQDTLELMRTQMDMQEEFTLFLADDEVFIRDLDYDEYFKYFVVNKDILGIKLYLGRNIKQRFGENDYFHQPEFKEFNTWDINCGLNLWKYFGSITVQIYRTKEIFEHIKKLNFSNPNTLESTLCGNLIANKTKLICFDKNIASIVQLNRVQDTHISNRSGSLFPETLNNLWLNGLRISDEIYDQFYTDNFEFINVGIEYESRQ